MSMEFHYDSGHLNMLWAMRKRIPKPDNLKIVNVIATKGLQDRNISILAGKTVENKGKLILTEIFPSVQKHIF